MRCSHYTPLTCFIISVTINKFFTLPHHDLSTYLDFFSRMKYPQENTDREALRFFEAVSNWRGEPELENVSSHLSPSTHPCVRSASLQELDLTTGSFTAEASRCHRPNPHDVFDVGRHA